MQTENDEYWNMLIDTVESKFQKSKLERRSDATNSKIKKLEASLKELEDQVQKEFNDVEILKTNSLPRLWHQMRKSLDEKIKHEEAELIDILMTYLVAEKTLNSTKAEFKNLQLELEPLLEIDEILFDLAFEQDAEKTDELRFLANKVALWQARIVCLNKTVQTGRVAEDDLHNVQKILVDPTLHLFPSNQFLEDTLKRKTEADIDSALDKARTSLKRFCKNLDELNIAAKELNDVLAQNPILFKDPFKPAFQTSTMPKSRMPSWIFDHNTASQIESFRRLILKKIKQLQADIKMELAKQSTLEKEWDACWSKNNL